MKPSSNLDVWEDLQVPKVCAHFSLFTRVGLWMVKTGMMSVISSFIWTIGINCSGYLISPTFVEAINTSSSSFPVRVLQDFFEKSEKYLTANRVKWFHQLLTNPRNPIFLQI
jgi:hypothetical protein